MIDQLTASVRGGTGPHSAILHPLSGPFERGGLLSFRAFTTGVWIFGVDQLGRLRFAFGNLFLNVVEESLDRSFALIDLARSMSNASRDESRNGVLRCNDIIPGKLARRDSP